MPLIYLGRRLTYAIRWRNTILKCWGCLRQIKYALGDENMNEKVLAF